MPLAGYFLHVDEALLGLRRTDGCLLRRLPFSEEVMFLGPSSRFIPIKNCRSGSLSIPTLPSSVRGPDLGI